MHFNTTIYRLLFPLIFYMLGIGCFAQSKSATYTENLIDAGIRALDKDQYAQSLELLFKAHKTATDNGLHRQQFLALNSIGTNYYRLLEYGESLNYYLDAYKIAIKELTPADEIIVLNNIAIIYSQEKKYDQAKEYFTKVYRISKEGGNAVTRGIAAVNLANLDVELGAYTDAEKYYHEASNLLNGDRHQLLAQIGMANCNLFSGQYLTARKDAVQLLNSNGNLDFYHVKEVLMTIVAESYLREQKSDSALVYINRTFQINPVPETKIKLFKLISEAYIGLNRPILALRYKDSLFNLTAKINAAKNAKLYENSKIKFELQNYKHKSMLDEARLKNSQNAFYYLLAFILVVLCTAGLATRNYFLKLSQKKLLAENTQQILTLELENEKRESLLLEKQLNEDKATALLNQERLKNEVEIKNRKLSAKALYISGKNQMIEEILTDLSFVPKVSENATLLAHISSLKNQLKADEEWDSFVAHFEEVNQGFLHTLQTKHPLLSANDIRYISYIYMGLSTKEIASMLNITQDSCRKRKERILSKMQLPKETILYEYLTTL